MLLYSVEEHNFLFPIERAPCLGLQIWLAGDEQPLQEGFPAYSSLSFFSSSVCSSNVCSPASRSLASTHPSLTYTLPSPALRVTAVVDYMAIDTAPSTRASSPGLASTKKSDDVADSLPVLSYSTSHENTDSRSTGKPRTSLAQRFKQAHWRSNDYFLGFIPGFCASPLPSSRTRKSIN